jgi:tetratricopeptide (TPR) repeat protein
LKQPPLQSEIPIITMTANADETGTGRQQHDELLDKMEKTRQKWMEDNGENADDTDRLLQEAIDLAVQQGRGWAPGEKEEYMKKILDDDYIPPIFCSTEDELQRTGLGGAFSALQFDDDPSVVMMEFKQKGTDAFLNGKRNEAKNIQYFRDAVNHYYEAAAWAQKVEPIEHRQASDTTNRKASEKKGSATEVQEYTERQLDELKSTLYANSALAHLQLKNWGLVRDDCKKALAFNDKNVKAWYRLARAYQMLQDWEEAGNAIDSGLGCSDESSNKELLKLRKQLSEKIRKARLARQRRERQRAERVSKVKAVWQHCQKLQIKLGRVALVASVTDDEDEAGAHSDNEESRWHNHFPHSGVLPSQGTSAATHPQDSTWSWPTLFVYPSHNQSDFVLRFGEDEMLAMRMAEMFPEMEVGEETAMKWDHNNEFQCSKLAVYFEIHCEDGGGNSKQGSNVIHPDSVERLLDQSSTMRFYESSRALKGDEGPEMASLVQAVERKRLHKQRKAWKKKHGSLWAKPDPPSVVRVHPAASLIDILTDKRMVVANFLVTLIVIPEDHPAHQAFLKEHKCVGVLQPNNDEKS